MKDYNKIILNIPHSSNKGILDSSWKNKEEMINDSVKKWTDWFTDIIFNPNSELNDCVIKHVFNLSRFVVDVERLENDPLNEVGEGILYRSKDGYTRDLSEDEENRLMEIYTDYIDNIRKSIKDKNTLLIDCHSFPSELEGNVDICIGHNTDESYDEDLVKMIKSHFEFYGYKVGINKPYGNSLYPKKDFPYSSVMIEINKKIYMNEEKTTILSGYYHIGNVINVLYEKILRNFS